MEEIKTPEAEEELKIQFRKSYTAREWLAQQKARIRVAVTEQLPSIFMALTEETKSSLGVQKPEDLKDLDFKIFQTVIGGFSKAYGSGETAWDSFLG